MVAPPPKQKGKQQSKHKTSSSSSSGGKGKMSSSSAPTATHISTLDLVAGAILSLRSEGVLRSRGEWGNANRSRETAPTDDGLNSFFHDVEVLGKGAAASGTAQRGLAPHHLLVLSAGNTDPGRHTFLNEALYEVARLSVEARRRRRRAEFASLAHETGRGFAFRILVSLDVRERYESAVSLFSRTDAAMNCEVHFVCGALAELNRWLTRSWLVNIAGCENANCLLFAVHSQVALSTTDLATSYHRHPLLNDQVANVVFTITQQERASKQFWSRRCAKNTMKPMNGELVGLLHTLSGGIV